MTFIVIRFFSLRNKQSMERTIPSFRIAELNGISRILLLGLLNCEASVDANIID